MNCMLGVVHRVTQKLVYRVKRYGLRRSILSRHPHQENILIFRHEQGSQVAYLNGQLHTVTFKAHVSSQENRSPETSTVHLVFHVGIACLFVQIRMKHTHRAVDYQCLSQGTKHLPTGQRAVSTNVCHEFHCLARQLGVPTRSRTACLVIGLKHS